MVLRSIKPALGKKNSSNSFILLINLYPSKYGIVARKIGQGTKLIIKI